MGNIVDYVKENYRSFSEKPFCDIDSLIFSQIAYLHLDDTVPHLYSAGRKYVTVKELAEDETLCSLLQGARNPEFNRELITSMARSRRYMNVKLFGYLSRTDAEREEQFAAVTFLSDCGENDRGFAYIAFRGTDDTFIAWKENINMSYQFPVPSQLSGAEYLSAMASALSCPLIVGGHSKGGNIAVFSVMQSRQAIKDRVTRIFSHDGPGFCDKIFSTEAYLQISPKISKTVPKSSLIGMLFHHKHNYAVVESHGFWFLQHDPFNWLVDSECSDFLYRPDITLGTHFMDKTLNRWIFSIPEEQRALISDSLYCALCSTGARGFNDEESYCLRSPAGILTAAKSVDSSVRRIIMRLFGLFLLIAAKNLINQ